jgi:hypothetical protein
LKTGNKDQRSPYPKGGKAEEQVMKLLAILATSAVLVMPLVAQAEESTTVIQKETPIPDETVTTHTETTGTIDADCSKKTVRKEDSEGNSVTKTKTNCPE